VALTTAVLIDVSSQPEGQTVIVAASAEIEKMDATTVAKPTNVRIIEDPLIE